MSWQRGNSNYNNFLKIWCRGFRSQDFIQVHSKTFSIQLKSLLTENFILMFSLYSVSQYLAAILSTNRDEFDESGQVNEKWLILELQNFYLVHNFTWNVHKLEWSRQDSRKLSKIWILFRKLIQLNKFSFSGFPVFLCWWCLFINLKKRG